MIALLTTLALLHKEEPSKWIQEYVEGAIRSTVETDVNDIGVNHSQFLDLDRIKRVHGLAD